MPTLLRLTWLVVALPFVYLAFIYGNLPDVVPIHFDLWGNPDNYGPKGYTWILPGVTLIYAVLSFWVLRRQDGGVLGGKQYQFLFWSTAAVALLITYTIYTVQRGGGPTDHLGLAVIVGILFAVLGNFFPIIRPNRHLGIRVPPTLTDERVWVRTHQFAGPVWVGCGLVMIIAGLLLPLKLAGVVLGLSLGVAIVWPIVYAYTIRDDQEPLV